MVMFLLVSFPPSNIYSKLFWYCVTLKYLTWFMIFCILLTAGKVTLTCVSLVLLTSLCSNYKMLTEQIASMREETWFITAVFTKGYNFLKWFPTSENEWIRKKIDERTFLYHMVTQPCCPLVSLELRKVY